MADNSSNQTTDAPVEHHKAGAFDIRNVIGGLIGVYGLILLVMGLFGDKELDKTGGVNANLWAGIIMLAIGLLFILWAVLSPVEVDAQVSQAGKDGGSPGAD